MQSPVQTGLRFFDRRRKRTSQIKQVYTRRFAFSIAHDFGLRVACLGPPVWSGCEMKCFCCITGTTFIYSVHEHDFESPWHWNEFTEETAIFHWLHFHYICWLNSSGGPVSNEGQHWIDGRVLEAKNYKSKPELRNSKMLTIFTHHLRVEIIIIVLPAAQSRSSRVVRRRSTHIWSGIYQALWNCWFYCDSGLFLLRSKEWSAFPFF